MNEQEVLHKEEVDSSYRNPTRPALRLARVQVDELRESRHDNRAAPFGDAILTVLLMGWFGWGPRQVEDLLGIPFHCAANLVRAYQTGGLDTLREADIFYLE